MYQQFNRFPPKHSKESNTANKQYDYTTAIVDFSIY